MEIGFWISEEHWNKGILSSAVPVMTHYIFNHFDVCRIFALVFERNLSSQRVLEKCGFLLEGRMRKAAIKENIYLDVLVYSLIN